MAHRSPDPPSGAGDYSAERFQRIRRLTEVSRALTYTTSLDEVLRLTVDRAADLMGADSGPGIAPNEIEAVFQPYHRTGATHGLGLGLAIARGLVQQMDGELTVQSEVGKGSTFTIWLPLGRPAY